MPCRVTSPSCAPSLSPEVPLPGSLVPWTSVGFDQWLAWASEWRAGKKGMTCVFPKSPLLGAVFPGTVCAPSQLRLLPGEPPPWSSSHHAPEILPFAPLGLGCLWLPLLWAPGCILLSCESCLDHCGSLFTDQSKLSGFQTGKWCPLVFAWLDERLSEGERLVLHFYFFLYFILYGTSKPSLEILKVYSPGNIWMINDVRV